MLLTDKSCLDRRAKKSVANEPTHETHGSVLNDLGFSSGLAAALKFKAELYQAIVTAAKTIRRRNCKEFSGSLSHALVNAGRFGI